MYKDPESAFRRGYHQGYGQALRDFGIGDPDAYEMLRLIHSWRDRKVTGHLPPTRAKALRDEREASHA